MRSHRIDVDGVTIHVLDTDEDDGEPAVVVLHGFTGSAETMLDLAARLAPRRVLCVDLVGHGRSDAPEAAGAYTMAAMVHQVASVAARLAHGPVDLVGYSLGGRVALTLLVEHHDLVERAVLIGATPGLATEAERQARRDADEALASMIEHEGLEAFVDRWMALPMWDTLWRRIGPTGRDASREQRLANDPRGLAASLRGAGTGSMPPVHDRLGEISARLLLVTGALDVKFTEINESMVTRIPNASLSVIADAGHAVHLERPDVVVAEIRAALR